MFFQDSNYKDSGVSHQAAQLNRYLPKPKNKEGHYLVDSKKSAADAVEEKERKDIEEKEEAAVAGSGADSEVGDAEEEGEREEGWTWGRCCFVLLVLLT